MNLRRRMNSLQQAAEVLRNPSPGGIRESFRRIAIDGRTIVFIIQKLKRQAAGFSQWFAGKEHELESDDLLRFFREMRDNDIHDGDEGIAGVSVKLPPGSRVRLCSAGISLCYIDQAGVSQERVFPRPHNWVATFYGDAEGGGAGFDVIDPDGKIRKEYVGLPSKEGGISLILKNSPTTHMGMPLIDQSLSGLCAAYVSYLEGLVREVETRWGVKQPL